MTRAAIVVPVITQLVEETREAIEAMRVADAAVEDLERKVTGAREIQRARRIELGMLLRKARKQLPDRGTATNGWRAYLEAIEMSPSTAHKFMEEAGQVSNRTMSTDPNRGHSEAANNNDDVPPPTDDDAPPESEVQAPAPKPNRDAYCTPSPIANALPKKLTIDPCSNPRSIVIAKTCYTLEAGQNGLELPWFGLYTGIELAYVNGPFSNLLPFAQKLAHELAAIGGRKKVGAGFLVNADNSPEWWHLLVEHLHIRLDFDERQEFIPPPGVEPSKNDRPQTLLMNEVFWAACDQPAFLELGTLWIKQHKA